MASVIDHMFIGENQTAAVNHKTRAKSKAFSFTVFVWLQGRPKFKTFVQLVKVKNFRRDYTDHRGVHSIRHIGKRNLAYKTVSQFRKGIESANREISQISNKKPQQQRDSNKQNQFGGSFTQAHSSLSQLIWSGGSASQSI